MGIRKAKAKKTKVVRVLSALTVVYALVFYYLAVQTKTCDIPVAASSDWFHDFWNRFLGCHSINELSDTLSGAFAPVAFFWLAGAVFIQSQELAAQREELDETQSVMREQLEVARQQVEETKASTALFRKQTEILEREQRARDHAEADAQFDEMVENFLAFTRDHAFDFNATEWEYSRVAVGLGTTHGEAQLFGTPKLFTIIPSHKFDDLADLAPQVVANAQNAADELLTERLEVDENTWDQTLFNEICDQLEALEAMKGLSLKHQILTARYQIKPMLITLTALKHKFWNAKRPSLNRQ